MTENKDGRGYVHFEESNALVRCVVCIFIWKGLILFFFFMLKWADYNHINTNSGRRDFAKIFSTMVEVVWYPSRR